MNRLALLALVLAPTAAAAQPTGVVIDVEVPTIVLDQGDAVTAEEDEALDLANIVQSAAKGVTTVQEAPAIVTVITPDEIRDRQFQDIMQLYDSVPGWSRSGLANGAFPTPMVRGQVQAVQFLHDGLSLFDPYANTPTISRVQPMELIKRVEMITGPGGVLWGSNSLLGILNVITKDAEDIEGVEVGGSLGHGDGDRQLARAYAMVGKSGLLGGKLKVFAHGSVETYKGAIKQAPLLLLRGALPQPNSGNTYGPLVDSDQPQSMFATVDGKLTYGNLQLRVFYPFGEMYNPLALSGNPNRESLVEDEVCDANPMDPICVDPRKTSRKNRQDTFDRYAVLEYQTRFAKDKAGIAVRGYMQEFVRTFAPLQVLTPSPLVAGGLAFKVALKAYRAGSALDGDIEAAPKVRVLYGAEAFREWKLEDVTNSRQGPGTQSTILAPYDLTRLPLLCPRIYDETTMAITPIENCPLTFAFPATRTVMGAYVNPQWRPTKKLILDIGARVQVAPDTLGSLSYGVNPTFAGSIVWNFVKNWHVKLNYAEGFRPPVFNNTATNGEAVNVNGDPNLRVEESRAAQAEINARIWKGERRIRELSFRIDGSYTTLKDQIAITSGRYENSKDRGVASAEFLGKLYVQGGHRIELGYTWLRVNAADRGVLRALPEHWFNLATVFSLVSDKLTATTNLRVVGAAEDANRLIEYRGQQFDDAGQPMSPYVVGATDLVLDRLPPVAELSVGLQYTPTSKLLIRATAYNAFAGHFYEPDARADYEPHLEYLPSPLQGFRAYLTALYQY
ncbi:MAG: TonB-dependent receptor plug domain-containing protein [Kofleriaceae bacterium]